MPVPYQTGESLNCGICVANFCSSLKRLLSKLNSLASPPGEKNEGRNQGDHDKHPILDFETQKRKMPHKKLHRFRPLFMQNRGFSSKNILFSYCLRNEAGSTCDAWCGPVYICWRRMALPRRIKDRAWPQPCEGCFKLRWRAKRRAEREQLVELRRIIADSIGSGDEHLPTLFRKRKSLGDGDDNAQPDRRCGFFTS
jgi:hypothetical protein